MGEADRPQYGELGQASYDPEAKTWRFGRPISQGSALHPLELPKLIIPPSIQQHSSAQIVDGIEGPTRRREKQVKALLQSYPELQPASGLLPELARISEAAEGAAGRHDSSRGNLLAVGKIPDQRTRGRSEVIAFPTGPTGSDLCIMQIQSIPRSWEQPELSGLTVPTIDGEEAIWEGPGVALQAFDFTHQGEEDIVYLIVRLPVETIIFRPVLRKSASMSSSRLEANLLYRLPIGKTGGTSHAHLSFSLWDFRRFAVIDQAGSWMIGESKPGLVASFEEILTRHLPTDVPDVHKKQMDDGWARILWVCNDDTVAVFSRRHAYLFSIAHQLVKELPKVRVYLGSGLGWNLDVSVLPPNNKYLVLLTSSHVVVYRIDAVGQQTPTSSITASVRHYRSPDDVSMRLHVVQDNDDFILFIRSDFSPLMLVYRIAASINGEVSISDPTSLNLHPTVQGATLETPILDVHVQVASHADTPDDASDLSVTPRHAHPGLYFYWITTLRKDLSILRTLCSTTPLSSGNEIRIPLLAPSPNISAADRENDTDIEGGNGSLISSSESLQHEPIPDYIQRRQADSASQSREGWTIDYEHIVQRLMDFEHAETAKVGKILHSTRDMILHNLVDDATPFRTLRELTLDETDFNDPEGVTEALEELLSLESPSQVPSELEHEKADVSLVLHRIPMPLVQPSLPQTYLLNAVHKSISSNWVAPLSEELPKLVLSVREQLTRQVASEIVLASHVLRLDAASTELPGEHPSQSQSQSERQDSELPVRPSVAPSSSHATPSVYHDASSQPQSPGPSSAAASIITSSSHPSTSAGAASARLSRYTTFSKAPPPPLPRSLTRILSHWQPGTDPATYDWSSTSRRFARQEDEENESEQLTERERRRLQRRTERYMKRQRRDAEETKRQRMLSNRAPEIVSASQPVEDARGGSVGAAVNSSQIPASQVVDGRHAGRRPVRKKRKSGF